MITAAIDGPVSASVYKPVLIRRHMATPYILNPRPLESEPPKDQIPSGEVVQTIEEYIQGLTSCERQVIAIGIRRQLEEAEKRVALYKEIIERGGIPKDDTFFQRRLENLGISSIPRLEKLLFHFMRNALCKTDWDDDPEIKALPQCYEAETENSTPLS